MSRNVSNPIELHKLSIVDKRQEGSPTRLSNTNSQIKPPSSPRKQGIQIALPLESSPVKDQDSLDLTPASSPPRSKRNSVSSAQSDTQSQDLLYKLAAKEREIVELEQKLQLAKKELLLLENHYRSVVAGQSNLRNTVSSVSYRKDDVIQNLSKKFQKTLDEVNNSPNVLKSKKSISNFFNGETNTTRSAEEPKGRGGFFQNLIDKFNDFSVAEVEEEEFDRTQNSHKDDFYLKEKLEYDDDEDIENEETGATLLDVQDPRLRNIYKR
ncbi:hypothetical protein HG537_0B04030 [Torulaspora globosa]|uniref:Uncharacterized protein n=1 Tax=Torulaspora globosa TaxID=48254 RepID=A0A7H9HP72_9SACH|nr:hypothetical protein HG537_0B04030 [Torulaspora sp. CBS 2947]